MASTDATFTPVKNQAYRVTFPILDADGDLVAGATSLDSEVSKDQGTFADCTNEATQIATSSGMYYLDLTSTEMNADTVAIIVKSAEGKTVPIVLYPQEAGSELKVDVTHWNGTAVATPDTAGYPKITVKSGSGTGEISLSSGGVTLSTSGVNAVADQVWDEAMSGHVAAGSAGAAHFIIRSGTAQAGAGTTITLDASASAVDDFYNNQLLAIVSGTGVGQGRIISDYVGSTKVATVATWGTNPDNTSVFVIRPFGSIPGASAPTAAEVADAVWDEATSGHTSAGSYGQLMVVARANTAQAGASTSITLDASASSTDDIYNYNRIRIIGGTGAGQSRQITDYVGSTKVATVNLAWTTTPSSDSVFIIDALGIDAATVAAVADAVWDEARAGHVTAGSFGEYTNADVLRISGDSTAADNLESATDGTGYNFPNSTIPTVTTVTNAVSADVTKISGDTTAADNAESFFDGTGYAGTNNVIPTVTAVSGAVGSVTGNVGGNVVGSVGSVSGAVGSVTGNVGGNVTGSVGSLATQAKVDVNAEVLDVLNVDTFSQPAQGAPAATTTLRNMIGFLYKAFRNRSTQTSSQYSLYNDDASTVDHKATFSDDGTTADRGEVASGP